MTFTWLPVLAALLSTTGVSAHVNLQAELHRQEQTAAAVLAEYEAQLEQQRLRLQQLEALHTRQHATWKEVAEQRMLVSQLQDRASSLDRMREELARWRDSIRSTDGTKTESDFVAVFDTRSPRIVGWVPSTLLENHPQPATAISNTGKTINTSALLEGPLVTAEEDPRLLSLTLAGLRLEQEFGQARSLDLQIAISRTHLERLRGLSHHEPFDRAELTSASDTLSQLEAQQQQTEARREALQAEVGQLERSANELPAIDVNNRGDVSDLDGQLAPCQLRLRFDQMLTEFQASDAEAELQFHKDYLSRLSEVVSQSPSATRELQWLDLQTQLRESRLHEAKQHLKWLAIEQQKLTAQWQLINRNELSHEVERPAEDYVVTALKTQAADIPLPVTYLETLSLASQQLVSDPYSDLDWAHVASIPRLRLDLSRMQARSAGTRPARPGPLLTIDYHAIGSPELSDAYEPRKLNFRAPYYEQYPFGNRRPQYRRSPGYHPWYFPGSPANFR